MPLDERLAVYDFMIREQTTVLGRVVDYLVEQYGRERGSLRGMLPFVGKDERDTAMSLAWIVGQTFAASHMMMTSDEWFGMAMTGGMLEAAAKSQHWAPEVNKTAKAIEKVLREPGAISTVPDSTGAKNAITRAAARGYLRSVIPEHAVEKSWRYDSNGAKYGVKFEWRDSDGNAWNIRAHSVDPTAPVGSNASKGWVVRVGVKWGGTGKEHYFDSKGNAHIGRHLRPRSANYNPFAANDTHMTFERFRSLLGRGGISWDE